MITVPGLAAEALGSFLTTSMSRRFGSTNANLTEVIQSAARLALDCIANSDALYHNVEHTMLVTLVGYDILKGRSLHQGGAMKSRSKGSSASAKTQRPSTAKMKQRHVPKRATSRAASVAGQHGQGLSGT